MLGKITLNESPYEKFGQLFFPFQFQTPPLLFVLCESGVSPTGGGCVNQVISDFVCVTNNQAGEGTVAMMSDLETSLSLGNLPPDFPCPNHTPPIFLPETGKGQLLSGKGGFPTSIPGLFIKVTAQSDLDPTTSITSDILTASTK